MPRAVLILQNCIITIITWQRNHNYNYYMAKNNMQNMLYIHILLEYAELAQYAEYTHIAHR
jgi:hypothetical protein